MGLISFIYPKPDFIRNIGVKILKTKKPVISVVIPCYNSEKFIFDCLSSLFNQKFDYDYELIVVDSSKDSTPDIIRDKFPSVKLLHFNSKTLAGKARNIGVKAAKSSIIAFTD